MNTTKQHVNIVLHVKHPQVIDIGMGVRPNAILHLMCNSIASQCTCARARVYDVMMHHLTKGVHLLEYTARGYAMDKNAVSLPTRPWCW